MTASDLSDDVTAVDIPGRVASTTSSQAELTRPNATDVSETRARWVLLGILAIALIYYLWGVRQDLPFTPEVDEDVFVKSAVRIAASGIPNPLWFGHPGSTVIYPLAAIYKTWDVVRYQGNWWSADPKLDARFASAPGDFYFVGRFISIGYAVASLIFIYLIGRRVFGARVGLIGAWLAVLCPLAVGFAQVTRTDSAAVFFAMLALWLCLRLYDRPTAGNQVLAGAAIGLAIATRYFMIALVPVLLTIDGVMVWRQVVRHGSLRRPLLEPVVGLLAIAAAFALSTPYFFLDLPVALQSVAAENEASHLGMDGLTPIGNLVYYVTGAIPLDLTWPPAFLAAAGAGLALWRRRLEPLLLLGFVLALLGGASLSALHADRWVIQLLPVLALFAADALETIWLWLSARLRWSQVAQAGVLLSAVALISARPIYQLTLQDIRQASPSTRVLARQWILQNLPAGSRIAEEGYTAPLDNTGLAVKTQDSLATGETLGDYRQQGYRYLVASNQMYGRYFAEPQRYAAETAFYNQLFKQKLLAKFGPSATQGGPVIRIYDLGGS